MARDTYLKRQKELARQRKRQEKAARKQQRKEEKARGEIGTDENNPEVAEIPPEPHPENL